MHGKRGGQVMARHALYKLRAIDLGGLVPPLTFNRGPHRDVTKCYIPTRFTRGRFASA